MAARLPEAAEAALAALHPGAKPTLTSSGHLTLDGASYLFKRAKGSTAQGRQLFGEALSLECMTKAKEGICPKMLARSDKGADDVFMLTEWHELGSMRGAESQKILGRKLGEMHKAAAPPGQAFGFDVPTFCGETEQDNRACDTWEEFWRERRIRDLIDRIGDPQLSKIGQRVCDEVVPRLLGKLDVRPSILHGDLWAGNAKQSMTSDEPIIFDSSAYYGHNEADLGITHMFGGFTKPFYDAYHEVMPKSEPVDEYEQRMILYEVYHHLNHTYMFGGSYKSGAMGMLKQLVDWYDTQA